VSSPIWGSWPDIYYCLTVTVLFFGSALSDERTGLSFVYAAGSRQRSISRIRVPSDSWPYFTLSDFRLPFSSPPTTRRVTVEVFELAFTRVSLLQAKSKSKLCYDRWSVGQSVLVSSPHVGLTTRFLLLSDSCGFCWCGAFSLTRERACCLQLLPALARHSQVRVRGDSWSYFSVSDSRLPQPGGPGPCIYILQEQCGPVITPDTGFPFRRLRLAGVRCRYSNPPPRGDWLGHFPYWLWIFGTDYIEDTFCCQNCCSGMLQLRCLALGTLLLLIRCRESVYGVVA
jgi:hypothetical protein